MIFSGLVHNRNITFFCPSSKHFGMSIKAIQWLAGVISHQPAQPWMITLTGLTAWAFSL